MRRHGRWVRSIVYAVLGRADRVDDVVQQVWTSVWQQAGTLRDPARWR
ncbi:MAG: sigma factor, partial [Myxococcota bacterium]